MKSENTKNRRVVVTGLGVVSSIGIGWQDFWKNLIAGKSGITKVESIDTSLFDRKMGGEVKNFDAAQFIDKKKIKKYGRASQMAIAASKMALKDAGLTLNKKICSRTGVCIGTTTGEIGFLEKINEARLGEKADIIRKNPLAIFPSCSLSINIALELGLSGQNCVFSNACASGNYSISRGFDFIQSGKLDFVLAGGSDGFSRILFSGFSRLYAVAPEKCQPFDKNRKGMIPGEGAGILLLEELESALARKAPIYAEIAGYGLSCDAVHVTNPSSIGISKAMQKALDSSEISSEQVDYICAHGTGTVENDKAETLAIKTVFGKRAVPISSIKSSLGHSMGAASALEATACCLALKEKKLPATMNFETKDPECDIDCIPNKSRDAKVDIVLNSSSAFGGNNASVVLQGI